MFSGRKVQREKILAPCCFSYIMYHSQSLDGENGFARLLPIEWAARYDWKSTSDGPSSFFLRNPRRGSTRIPNGNVLHISSSRMLSASCTPGGRGHFILDSSVDSTPDFFTDLRENSRLTSAILDWSAAGACCKKCYV